MASDDITSQDSAVIGDDLVEALGFEPISADGASSDNASSGNPPSDGVEDQSALDADGGSGEVAVLDEVPLVESATDESVAIEVDGAGTEQAHDDEIDVFVSAAELAANGDVVDLSTPVDESIVAENEAVVVDPIDLELDAPPPSIFDLPERSAPAVDPPAVDPPDVAELNDAVLAAEVADVEVADVEIADAGITDVEAVESVETDDESRPTIAAADTHGGESRAGTAVPPAPDALDLTELASSADDDIIVVEDEPAPQPEVVSATPVAQGRRQKIRARKSRRVVRHVDPWSVLTFSVLFHLCLFSALLLSSVLVWNVALAAGAIENTENFIRELGDYDTFQIHSDQVFRAAVLIAGMLTLASSVMVVLLTVVFNLISDLIGGIRVTVIEEETVRLPPANK